MFCFSFSTQKLQHLQHQIDKLKEENFTLETCKYEQKTVAHYFHKWLHDIPPTLPEKNEKKEEILSECSV